MAKQQVNPAQLKAQEAWIVPTLLNSWVDFGSGFAGAGYMKDSMGFVHLKGMVKNGAVGSIIFNLPVGYRPSATLYMVAISSGPTTPGIINIGSTGSITVDQGSGVYMSLSSIIFKAEQ